MTKKPTKQPESSIQAAVLDQIRSGKVRMKPRQYFTLLTALTVLASAAAALVTSYLIGIMTFIVRIQTADTPARGARANLSEALANFPWWAVVFAALLLAAALWLMRTHGRMYRHRLSVLVLGFVLVSVALGVGMSYMSIGHPESGVGGNGEHMLEGGGRGRMSQ